ncbi:MAG: DEAD/DEAH box helicase [Candidatus Aenigmatarchaeota archaeon]
MVSELLRNELIELREYQINIANTAIKGNTLVILPTGTGKTIIAIIVASNRLMKFPDSRVLILAPTRPLVLQHANTFRKLFKIDKSRIVDITGKISKEDRKFLYKYAKIIVATPQTIQNDLEQGILTLNDFSLVVFDEAHRCVKEYSYTYIAKKYLEQSKYPLILALTASPGSEKERIEEIKNHLKIEYIEIRSEYDRDIKPYIKKIEKIFVEVELPKEIKRAIEEIEKVRRDLIKDLINLGILNTTEISKKEMIKIYEEFVAKSEMLNKKVFSNILFKLLQLIKVEYLLELLETQSSTYFLDYLEKLKNSKKIYEKMLVSDLRIKIAESIVKEFIEKTQAHPKLEKLEEIISFLIQKNPNVKIIVFANYRATVEFIYKELKDKGIKITKLVGQAKRDKYDGMSQKEQAEVIKDFANGIYNVLVCSSVGEEGLDIPKTDYAIFYEPVPSEIRAIQRRGRVGRQEHGKVIILITKNTRDEAYYWAAFHKEKRMRKIIYDIKKELANEAENFN